MFFLEGKLQDVYNKLLSVLSRFTVRIKKINCIPTLINEVVFGTDNLKLHINNSAAYELGEDDLKNKINIEAYEFYGCTALKSITIPDSVTSIGDFAFYYCTALKSATIGNSVTSIGGYVFRDCAALTSITIPDSVTGINNGLFYYCTSLESIVIPDSVTRIGVNAFEGCEGLTSITIPSSVTYIDEYAFTGCVNLTDIYLNPIVPPILGESPFDSTVTTIHIPIGSGDAYKTATNWCYYSSIIVEDIEI